MEDVLRNRDIDLKFMEELIKENPSFNKLTNLLEAGADINSKYYIDNSNCIMDMIYLCSDYFKDDIDKAKILIEFMINNGADIHHTDYFGNSIIHCCLNKENTNLIKLFLEKGVNPNYIDIHKCTPLDIAEQYILRKKPLGSIKEILLEYGAKTSFELRSNQIKNYLKVDFTSPIEFCFMSESGYLMVCDIPGADENEFLELLSIYQSFCDKEIINIHSEELNRIQEFNEKGLNFVKLIISKLPSIMFIEFHYINVKKIGHWWKHEMYVYHNTEFGLFDFQIPRNDRYSF